MTEQKQDLGVKHLLDSTHSSDVRQSLLVLANPEYQHPENLDSLLELSTQLGYKLPRFTHSDIEKIPFDPTKLVENYSLFLGDNQPEKSDRLNTQSLKLALEELLRSRFINNEEVERRLNQVVGGAQSLEFLKTNLLMGEQMASVILVYARTWLERLTSRVENALQSKERLKELQDLSNNQTLSQSQQNEMSRCQRSSKQLPAETEALRYAIKMTEICLGATALAEGGAYDTIANN